MFRKIRQVSGRAITVESLAAGLRAALATGAGKLVGTLKNCSVTTGTWRVRLEKKRTCGASAAVASSSTSPPWAAKAHPPRSVPPRTSSTAPWATPKSLSEVDKIHDSDQTALLRTAWEPFIPRPKETEVAAAAGKNKSVSLSLSFHGGEYVGGSWNLSTKATPFWMEGV